MSQNVLTPQLTLVSDGCQLLSRSQKIKRTIRALLKVHSTLEKITHSSNSYVKFSIVIRTSNLATTTLVQLAKAN
jgi:hypothetical protein